MGSIPQFTSRSMKTATFESTVSPLGNDFAETNARVVAFADLIAAAALHPDHAFRFGLSATATDRTRCNGAQ